MPRHTFRNTLSKWLNNRKDRKRLAAEAHAAREILRQIEDNTRMLIDVLSSVDFLHSALPESILADYAEGCSVCQMEWNTRALVQMLQQDSQNINMDIYPIDVKLFILAQMFKQFVAHGDTTSARIALDALIVGIQDIRCKLPLNMPQLAEAFVSATTEYMEKWIDLVRFALYHDGIKRNLDTMYALAREAEEAQNGLNADLHKHQTIDLENALQTSKQLIESMRSILLRLPSVTDPDLMNHYRETMENFMQGLDACNPLLRHIAESQE